MRANPDTNPMRPMMPTGVPMREFGPIQVIDWSAVQNPARRVEFGLPAQMPPEQPEPDGGFRIPTLDDQSVGQWFEEAANNIKDAISDYFQRQQAITESRRESQAAFEEAAANAGYQLATAAIRETPGAFKRAVTAFGRVLRDEFNIPLPTGQTVDRVWNNVVVPVATNAQTVLRQAEKRGAAGLPQMFGSQVGGLVGRVMPSGGEAEPEQIVPESPTVAPEEVSAGQMSMVAPTMTELNELRRKLAAAGFRPENIDQDAVRYQEFMRNMRTFQNIEARSLGQRVEFTSIPLGLEPFVFQTTNERGEPVYRLQSRYYDPVANTLMQLSRPGAYTQEEVQQRLAADPSLLEASRSLTDRSNQYLTPERIVAVGDIMPRLGQMSMSELASLKQHMFKHGYYDSTDADVMGQLHFRDINQNTITAFQRMVRLAQENGYTWEGWRERIDSDGAWFGDAPKEPAAPLIRLTSRDDLRAIANRVAQQTIGYQLPEDELEQFVASYQAMERQVGSRLSGGGAVEMAPDAAVMAETAIRENRQAEADAFAVGNTIDVLRQIMSGGRQ